jgi:coproporphyrinogen III oxidase
MKGKVFEKVGVNVSTVRGSFAKEFAGSSTGRAPTPAFVATGISLVAHMSNPHVPAVHMNTRFLTTTKAWFGGGADLNPPIPYAEDTAEFHAAMQAACDPHGPIIIRALPSGPRITSTSPTAGARGVGGIFADHLECADDERAGRPISNSSRISASVPRRLPGHRAAADEHALHRRGRGGCSNTGAAMPSSTSSTTAARSSG